MNELQLRQQCTQFFHGHHAARPAVSFSAMSAWCAQHEVGMDVYGKGDFVQEFEAKIADLTGYPAAMFCITGTMAQMIALKLACERHASDVVGLHASSHILLHEQNNYQHLQLYKVQHLGEPYRPWLASDLAAVPCPLACAAYELPMREIGGQMPSWQDLLEVKKLARTRGIHLHMDGARLWEAANAYGKPIAEVCEGFDSCYVSFYKGIAGMGGAMLLGSEEFISQARVWMHRFGGSVIHRLPYVVSAAMQFDTRLAAMPLYLRRAQEFARLIAQQPQLRINPAQPQCNLFHLYFPASSSQVNTIRNQIADEERVWLFSNARNTALPNQSMVELYCGDNLLAFDLPTIARILQLFVDKLEALQAVNYS